jgi:Aldo/keto reductase family
MRKSQRWDWAAWGCPTSTAIDKAMMLKVSRQFEPQLTLASIFSTQATFMAWVTMNCSFEKPSKEFPVTNCSSHPNTSLTLNRMGYGAMQLAGKGVFGPPRDVDAAVAVLREAVALGINHIDTSDFYGPHITSSCDWMHTRDWQSGG